MCDKCDEDVLLSEKDWNPWTWEIFSEVHSLPVDARVQAYERGFNDGMNSMQGETT